VHAAAPPSPLLAQAEPREGLGMAGVADAAGRNCGRADDIGRKGGGAGPGLRRRGRGPGAPPSGSPG
jgi:hypothetical protein